MIGLTVYLACIFITCAVAFLAATSDYKGMTIPNHYSAIIAGSFLLCTLVLHFTGYPPIWPSVKSALIAAFIFFAVTFIMFAMRILGAADSKLGTACALWMGFHGLTSFLFYMTIFGGVLAIASLVLKKWKPLKTPRPGSWIEKAQMGENKVPYGIAIFTGMLASFVNLGYFDYETFASFLSG